MPWTNQSGGGNGSDRGPWGRGPTGGSGGGGNGPPDLEELLRQGQDRLRRLVPGPGFTTGSLLVVILILAVVWLATGFYTVGTNEQGVVLRFGKYVATTSPGIRYHLPWPIETAYTPAVTQSNQITIGYRVNGEGDQSAPEEVSEESLMLTGDENIIDVNFTVQWQIKDVSAFLFNVARLTDQDGGGTSTIRAVAESAMREIVGQSQFERILTQDRELVQVQVRDLMQKTLDEYNAGIAVNQVAIQKADPPGAVISAYRDVQKARADQERKRNEAEAYANTIIPQARGTAAHIVQEAEAYKQQVIAEASGEAKRFSSIYEEYKKAPDVTRRRMYLETMASVLGPMNKVIVDEGAAKGFVPYFPVPSANGQGRPPIPPVSSSSEAAQAHTSEPTQGASQ
ncbi:MAG TPA: FtsH protease activity modulator HflK [Rhizomicrobium sp.]|jgi:membrane protease subunit HflK|nr:FtsH protease activity modulator HflK [Rhizomicrobium sp.]